MIYKRKLINLYEQLYMIMRRFRFNLRYRFTVLSMEKTVEYIRTTGCSIARFGDGEFGLITGSRKPDFQDDNKRLSRRLQEVCACRDTRLLVCIPHCIKTTKDCNEFSKQFWSWWIWDNNNLEKAAICLGLTPWRNSVFGDAQITRPYMDWNDKSKAQERFQDLMSLWEGKDVIIIEGDQTRLGVGNDLMNNVMSVHRIICPSHNAFDHYEQILCTAKKCDRKKLFLIALGPTATVLAYDLAMDGYQALDIGHIDIEYEWFLRRANQKIAIPGKFTQEVREQSTIVETITTTNEDLYLSQIIARI